MRRITVKWAFVLFGALLCASILGGCGSTSADGQIDVPRLQQELARVIHLEKLAQGFDFTVDVSCSPSANDGLHFDCHVDLARANNPTQSATVIVTCRPPGAEAQRCVSDTGDALQ